MENFEFFQSLPLRSLLPLKDFLRKIFLQNLSQNATINSKEKWMEEEQERPKIKLKIRQIEEPENNFAGEEPSRAQDINKADKESVQKITIHAQKNDEEKENAEKSIIRNDKEKENAEKSAKKRTIFQISAIVLTVLLVIAIVVEIGVMIWLKNKSEDLKHKNDELPQETMSISVQI